MRRNYKFHAIAIAIICLVIVLLYMLIGPKAALPAATQGDRFVQIYSATWGENCNRYITEALHDQQSVPLAKDANGVLISKPATALVAPDNVLNALSAKCNGQLTCNFDANSVTLGVEPLQSCFKRLKLSYRCFVYDRLWTRDVGQGDNVTLDCHEAATPAAK